MSKSVFLSVALIMVVAAFVMCQDYEPFTIEEVRSEAYMRNFEKKYGSVDPAQSWDLSSYIYGSYQLEPAAGIDGFVEGDMGFATDSLTWLDNSNGTAVAASLTRADNGMSGTPHFPTQDESRLELDDEGFFNLSRTPVKWLQSALPEGKYGTKSANRNKADPFKQVFDPTQTFEIVPIFEGYSKSIWDLYVGVITPSGEEYSIRVWGKGENMQRAKKCGNCAGTGIKNQAPCAKCSGTGHGEWIALGKDENSNTMKEADAWVIRTKPILLDRNTEYQKVGSTEIRKGSEMPDGSQLYYYMKIIDPAGNGANVGDLMSSMAGQMRKLREDVKVNNQTFAIDGVRNEGGLEPIIWVIGVEVAPCLDPLTDCDINDVVFLFVGHPELPEVVKITDQKVVNTEFDYVSKRYMCEDMGSVVDWDFNDVVFDVETHKLRKVTTVYYEDGTSEVIEDVTSDVQKCTIRYLCGTIPFKIKVGNTESKMVTDPTNQAQTIRQLKNQTNDRTFYDGTGTPGWSPNYAFSVSGWDPNSNNVQIYVWIDPENVDPDYVNVEVNDRSAHGSAVAFPRAGEVPLILATDVSQAWMEEGQDIPREWWR